MKKRYINLLTVVLSSTVLLGGGGGTKIYSASAAETSGRAFLYSGDSASDYEHCPVITICPVCAFCHDTLTHSVHSSQSYVSLSDHKDRSCPKYGTYDTYGTVDLLLSVHVGKKSERDKCIAE